MNRPRLLVLLILVSLLHFAADAAFAGGLVLCVGPDGHRAVESEHLTVSGCEPASVSGQAHRGALSPRCIDRPIPHQADTTAGGAPQEPPSSAALARVDSSLSTHSPPVFLGRSAEPGVPPGPLAQRTTALLL